MASPIHPSTMEMRLNALSIVESRNNDHAIGKKGEISRYQILPRVWREYSKLKNYRNSSISRNIAKKIMSDREILFRKITGRIPNHKEWYLLWNAPSIFRRSDYKFHITRSILKGRAERFSNVVESTRQ